MCSHKAQTFSLDLVFGVLIFLIASSFFYYNIRYIPTEKISQQLTIVEESLFTNLDFGVKEYDRLQKTSYSFLDGYKINEKNLINFAKLIEEPKLVDELLFKNIIVKSYDIDTCIFFEDGNENIIPISNGYINLTGIGNPYNKDIQIEDDINCGLETKFGKAKPACKGKYKFTRKLSKPALRYEKRKDYLNITKLNVLMCIKEKE